MRIITIHLHPFARFNDLTLDLSDSLVVIHNLNEAGKSTVRKAIFHALFTSTKQTKAQCEQVLGPFFPLPAGDYAKVTLVFEHDGSTWTLTKQWGAQPQSLLKKGSESFADPTTIQDMLGQMLTHNQAAFQHVLFTGQGELERTIQTITQKKGDLRDVRDLFRAEDIDEQALRIRLDEKIKLAFGRWDSDREQPERQNGGERGITNPWKQDVGLVLKAWYDWKGREAEHAEIVEIEKNIDGTTSKLAELQRIYEDAKGFVVTYAHLESDLHERKTLEEKVGRLSSEKDVLTKAFKSWIKADAGVGGWVQQKAELDAQKSKLDLERSDAQKHSAGKSTRITFAGIEKAKTEYETAKIQVHNLKCPILKLVTAVGQLSTEITDAENKIAARKLNWRIDTENPGHVLVQNGIGHEESLDLGSGSVQGEAEARVRVTVGGLTLTVNSGSDDSESTLRKLEQNRKELAGYLLGCNVSTKADFDDLVKQCDQANVGVRLKKAAYEATLGGKDFEEWQAGIKELDALPQSRDIVTINAVIGAAIAKIAQEQQKVDTYQTEIDEWTKLYGDHDTLTEKLLESKNDLNTAQRSLADLKTLPDQFTSAGDLLEKLKTAQENQNTTHQSITELTSRLNSLTIELDGRRGDDATEAVNKAQRQFERAKKDGECYLAIKRELDLITCRQANNHFDDYTNRVVKLFCRITGGQTQLEFVGQVPAQVVRDEVRLPPELLSAGGAGALAFAVRLAMAESYLDNGGGFLMFDDPLVNFDPLRMANAAKTIQEISKSAQVIYFTCHEHHCEALAGKEIAI